MDVSPTLLYTFLAVLQIYIYFSVGIIAYLKKITSSKIISELIFNFFLPVYCIVELARMATWKNIEIMWILMVSVFIAMMLGFFVGKLIYASFRLDYRMKNSFPYLISVPSLGTLPLVMGRALCYPGGMLEGDPNCESILGFMIINSLIFFIILFSMGFTIIPGDANLTTSSSEKMSYLGHHLIPKLFDKDYAVYHLFKNYMKDKKKAEEMFSAFSKKYKFEIESGDNLPRYWLKKDPEVKLEFDIEDYFAKFVLKTPLFKGRYSDVKDIVFAEIENLKKEEFIHNKNDQLMEDYFINSINEMPFDSEASNNDVNIEINNVGKKEILIETNKKLNEEDEKKSHHTKSHASHLAEDNLSYAVNYVLENKEIEEINEKQRRLSKNELVKLKTQTLRRLSTLEKTSNDVEKYYILAFIFIENFINEDKVLLFEEEQSKIIKNLKEFPPKFPIVKSIELSAEKIKIIDQEFEIFEKKIKSLNENFAFKPKHTTINLSTIIIKLLSPPIVACFLGLIIGMSGMREILFSKNHYISNVVEGLYVVTRANVPFLYVALGISMLSVKNINFSNTPISTKYVLLTFLIRFVILPGFGLLYVYLWKVYFGGIVAESKVFRISMFIPFCLPCAATVVIVVNMLDVLKEETSLVLFIQNTTMVITLTVWYLIYFVVIG
jgi:hypothetical protein